MMKENVKWSVCLLSLLLGMQRSDMSKTESDTWYKEYTTPDGFKVVVRISTHPINFDEWLRKEREDSLPSKRISILFRDTFEQSEPVIHEPRSGLFHVFECIYNMQNKDARFTNKQVHDIADAVKSIADMGEYKDPTGMATQFYDLYL